MEKSTTSVVITALGLHLTFIGFNAVHESSSDNHINGDIRNLITLSVIIISCITLVPYILQRLHPKFGFIFGSLCLLFFIPISQTDIQFLLYISSFVVGIGYSLVMISWQQIVARCANLHELKHGIPFNSTIGRFQSITVSSICLSRSFGKILSLLLMDGDIVPLGMGVLILCFVGLCPSVIVMINLDEKFVRVLTISERTPSTTPFDPVHDENTPFSFGTPISFKSPTFYNTFNLNGSGSGKNMHHHQFAVAPIDDEMEMEIGFGRDPTTKHKKWSVWRLWTERKLQCLILISIYWGFWLQFMWSEFPSTIKQSAVSGQKRNEFQIAIVIGIVDGICSFVVGQISDYVHRLKVMGCGVLVQVLIFSVHYGLLMGNEYHGERCNVYLMLMAMVIAIADALFSTTMYILYPLFMGQRTDTFANCVFWQTFGFAFAYIVHVVGIDDITSKLIMYYMSVLLCCLPLFLSRYAMKVSRPKFNIVIQKWPSNGAFN